MVFKILLLLSLVTLSCKDRLSNSEANAEKNSDPAAIDEAQVEMVASGIGDIFRFNYAPRNKGLPNPAVRAAFRRTLGCAAGTFEVLPPSSEAKFNQGMFKAPEKFDMWLRASRDRTVPVGEDDFDQATVAYSIKVLPKKSKKNLPVEPVAGEQDFILQNHPVFFAKTAKEFFLAFAQPAALSPENQKKARTAYGERESQRRR